MICKKCSKEYDDSFGYCPTCGAENEREISYKEFFSDMEFPVIKAYDEENPLNELEGSVWDDEEYSFDDSFGQEGEKEPEPVVTFEVPEYKVKKLSSKKNKKESKQELKRETENIQQTEKEKATQSKETDKQEENTEAVKNLPDKATSSEKSSLKKLVAIVCAVFLSAVGLAALAINTDVFVSDNSGSKTVALSGLSAEETTLLEQQLGKSYTAFVKNFDSTVDTDETVISRINPADSGNFYTRLTGDVPMVMTVADPAMRYGDEYGSYSYYKIAAGSLDKVLDFFGTEAFHSLNGESVYYYDGNYYIKPSAAGKTTPAVTAKILKTKAVNDGSYYVECNFFATGTDGSKSVNRYLVVKKLTDEAENVSFVVKKSSAEPLFTSTGASAETDALSGFEMKSETIECKTDDGTVFRKYNVVYPVFSGNSEGEQKANKFFTDMLAVYKLNAQSAQKDYETFISDGGKKEDLPYIQTVITKVTLNDSERLSFVESICEYSPELPEPVEETTTEEDDYYYEEPVTEPAQPEQEPVSLPENRAEAYTFDKKTGDFVLKDTVLGKDYLVISETLYRIYNGYDYSTVAQDVEEATTAVDDYYDYYYDYYDDYDYDRYGYEDSDVVPEDEDGLGMRIYESAWALTKEGVSFYFVNDEGFIKEVILSATEVEKLVSQAQETEVSVSDSDIFESTEVTEITDVTFEER